MMTLLAPSTPPSSPLEGAVRLVEGQAGSQLGAARPRTPEIDSVILEGARRGEREALQAFIEHYQGMVFAFLGRALGRSVEVEDLSQEVFLRAYRALPRFEKRAEVRTSTWLLTIAARLVLDERKKRRLSLSDAPSAEIDWTTPEDERKRRALGFAIETAAGTLPEEQRISFVLAEFHGLSLEEIASATATPAATVKTRLFRARAHLREKLAHFWRDS